MNSNYECTRCGARDCKLWRPPHDADPLHCARCLSEIEDVALDVTEEGLWPSDRMRVGVVSRALPSRTAIRVVNLRRALATANRCLKEHGQTLLVGCSETSPPSFAEASRFYAEARRVDSDDSERSES